VTPPADEGPMTELSAFECLPFERTLALGTGCRMPQALAACTSAPTGSTALAFQVPAISLPQ
jgi:hypothetical protein